MGLTGIQIFKLLPKTNCGECGVPTCLAFAMNLASGKAELESVPTYRKRQRKNSLPNRRLPFGLSQSGPANTSVKVGGETVLFRHEKTFVNPPGFAVLGLHR